MRTLPELLPSSFFEVSDGNSYHKRWRSQVSLGQLGSELSRLNPGPGLYSAKYACYLYAFYHSEYLPMGLNMFHMQLDLFWRSLFAHLSFYPTVCLQPWQRHGCQRRSVGRSTAEMSHQLLDGVPWQSWGLDLLTFTLTCQSYLGIFQHVLHELTKSLKQTCIMCPNDIHILVPPQDGLWKLWWSIIHN